jgi:hypothetical protein
MARADWIIDLGPGAGRDDGRSLLAHHATADQEVEWFDAAGPNSHSYLPRARPGWWDIDTWRTSGSPYMSKTTALLTTAPPGWLAPLLA